MVRNKSLAPLPLERYVIYGRPHILLRNEKFSGLFVKFFGLGLEWIADSSK
jgi:hypothetical protein